MTTSYIYRMSAEEANANWITRKYNRALEYIQERNTFFVDEAYNKLMIIYLLEYIQERNQFFVDEAYNRLMDYFTDDLADLRDTERCALR